MKFLKLFETGNIGRLKLKNRAVMPAMGTHQWNEDGTVSQRTIDYYSRRALGGAALITVEACTVHDSARIPFAAYASDDSCMEGLSRLAKAIRDAGAKSSIQLFHPGRQWSSKYKGTPPIGPSDIPAPPKYEVPRVMNIDDIAEYVNSWADAAWRCKQAGFDAVDIHGAHGYLIFSFISPLSNKRTDAYGGSTENRARFAIEVVKAIRNKVGRDFPVIFRISSRDAIEGGLEFDETKVVIKLLEAAGIDAISLSAGSYLKFDWIIQPGYFAPAFLTPFAQEVKKSVQIPVICAGRINTPALADSVLREGKADFIAFGRGLLADPDFVKKAREGREGSIRKCVACNACVDRLLSGFSVECAVNPEVSHEAEFALVKAARPKRVMVVGGGPAGMQAAVILKERGHQVELYEKSDKLGGQLNLAAIPDWKRGYADEIAYLSSQLKDLGIKLHLNTEMTARDVRKKDADVVVIATGAVLGTLDVPGIDLPNVVHANDVLLGKASVGKEVVIIGGGPNGCEMALFLARQGTKVTIVEMLSQIGVQIGRISRLIILDELRSNGVGLMAGAKLKSVAGDGITVTVADGDKHVPADTVILAVGAKSDDCLYKEVMSMARECYCVGDAVKPRTCLEAIHEGARVALKI